MSKWDIFAAITVLELQKKMKKINKMMMIIITTKKYELNKLQREHRYKPHKSI